MRELARFLLHPDKALPDDVQEVLDTAALLDLTEFQIFQLAFADWYGREATEKTIERFFVPYMFDEQVPHFVRQFTRKKLEQAREGWVHEEPLARRLKRTLSRDPRRGLHYALLLIAIMAMLLVLANYFTPYGACQFPPCY